MYEGSVNELLLKNIQVVGTLYSKNTVYTGKARQNAGKPV